MKFATFFSRVRQETNITTQLALATVLGVNRSAITQAKNRDAVPEKWLLTLSRHFGLSPDWLEYGLGDPRLPAHHDDFEMYLVPRVHAVLSAGGGSLDVDGATLEVLPFRHDWLSRKGNPAHMVLMDVSGNSMEPSIMSGDTVLIDQSRHEARAGEIFAFGFEDTILVKRLQREGDVLMLASDNPEYAPIPVRGDERELLRVIGKVVWMCRTPR